MTSGLDDGGVIAAAYRIARRLHVVGIGRTPAEEVGDDERAEAPLLGIDARPGARRIELQLVRSARIEHQEIRHRPVAPFAPQEIAPSPARRELRAGCAELHHMPFNREATSTRGFPASEVSFT